MTRLLRTAGRAVGVACLVERAGVESRHPAADVSE